MKYRFWWGFLGFLGIKSFVFFKSGHYLDLLWALFFIYFLYFIPNSKHSK